MSNRGFIGAWDTRRQASRKPITATEGVLGIIMLLSYYAGGKKMFPPGVNPDAFIEGIEYVPGYGKAVFTDDDMLSGLCESFTVALDRRIKSVSSGSLKVYLSNLRQGKYPNGGGIAPAFATAYKANGQLIIYPRNFDADVESGEFEETPAWLRDVVGSLE